MSRWPTGRQADFVKIAFARATVKKILTRTEEGRLHFARAEAEAEAVKAGQVVLTLTATPHCPQAQLSREV